MTKKSLFRMPLRPYFTLLFVFILISSCLLATGLVVGGLLWFNQGQWDRNHLILALLLTCALTIGFGALTMWFGAYRLTQPLIEMNQAVIEIAKGDFSTQIHRSQTSRKGYPYLNELDQLSLNINHMALDLGQLEAMRRSFVSSVAHEFKTPLTSLSGIAELLQEQDLPQEEKKELLSLLAQETQRLSQLADMILSLSRVENQTRLAKDDLIRLDEQLRQAIILITEKWSHLTIEISLDCPEMTLLSNANLLMEVWINLLDNAVKYSKEPIVISIKVRKSEDSLEVVISDKGIGMTSQELDRAFESFYQADASHKREGSGLGLAIVKSIIQHLDGSINLTSQVQKGTRVSVFLPTGV